MVAEALPPCESSPRSNARTPSPQNGEYIITSFSDDLGDPTNSPSKAV